MICTECGYSMSAFETACPRCTQREAPASNPPAGGAQQNVTQGAWPPPGGFPTQPPPPNTPPPHAPQGPWPQPGHVPAQPPAAYPPQGYQTPYPVAVPKKSNPGLIIAIVVACFLGFIGLITIGSLAGKGSRPAARSGQPAAPAEQTPAVSAEQTPAPQSQVRIGPSFSEVDSKMDDRLTQWTDAQKDAYWATVEGTQVTWMGEVVEVTLDGGGRVTLKCNPKTMGSDVTVSMDGSQLRKLPSLSKKQQITIEGILEDHSMFGYTVRQGRVIGL